MKKLINLKFILLFILPILLLSHKNYPVKVLLAGDSTMADKPLFKKVMDSVSLDSVQEVFLERGWGQLLPEFLNGNKALVVNYAKNGRSTRSFISEGLWTELMNNTQKGDFVIIQFGHNDEAITKGERYTNPDQFRLNFIAFVEDVKAKGGNPILCTPVCRRKFDNKGNLEYVHGKYPDLIREVSKMENVPLIDMEKLTYNWIQSEGVAGSKQYFHKIASGVSRIYPKGLDDNTHFNEKGARIVAKMFSDEVKKQQLKLSKLLR